MHLCTTVWHTQIDVAGVRANSVPWGWVTATVVDIAADGSRSMIELELHHHTLLARVAHFYYEEQLTQNAIADRVGLSRVKIHRLLKEARETGVVRITVDWPVERRPDAESALRESFGLCDAVVVGQEATNGLTDLDRVGAAGAHFLEDTLLAGHTMAVCLGRTTHAVIEAMKPSHRSGIRVAQAIGSLPLPNPEHDSASLARLLADKLGGEVTFLRAPPMADTPAAAATIAGQRDISMSLDAARSADVALVGIGSLMVESSAMYQSGAVTADELREARARGAVGDVAWRLLNEAGELVDCALNDRVIGVSLDDLGKIPTTIAAALGSAKVEPVLAALRSGVIDVLVTDSATAEAVMSES